MQDPRGSCRSRPKRLVLGCGAGKHDGGQMLRPRSSDMTLGYPARDSHARSRSGIWREEAGPRIGFRTGRLVRSRGRYEQQLSTHSQEKTKGICRMRIAFVSIAAPGHLNPMTTLARQMKTRGHDVVFSSLLDTEGFAHAAGLSFVPLCEKEFPAGPVSKFSDPFPRFQRQPAMYPTSHPFPQLLHTATTH